jgi:hypothetical protein
MMNFEALPYSQIRRLFNLGRSVPRSFSRVRHDDQGQLMAVFNQRDGAGHPVQVAIPYSLGTLPELHVYTRDFAAGSVPLH